MNEAVNDEPHIDEYLKESRKLLLGVFKLCERQFVQKEACYDLYERHVDFHAQLRFVKNHEPHVADDVVFCTEGEVLEFHATSEFFNLLTRTAHLSKLRAVFDREKISGALRALNTAYSLGIARVHMFLPEDHALFQPPPEPNFDLQESTEASLGNFEEFGTDPGIAQIQPEANIAILTTLPLPPGDLASVGPGIEPRFTVSSSSNQVSRSHEHRIVRILPGENLVFRLWLYGKSWFAKESVDLME